jgi:hypothetical protein
MPEARAIMAMGTWNEEAYQEGTDQRKMTRVTATFSYTGAVEGTGYVDYLMVYTGENLGYYLGLERIEGAVEGKTGSFVRQHIGTFDPTSVTAQWVILQGTGTDELAGISGQGSYVMAGQDPYDTAFDYDIASA